MKTLYQKLGMAGLLLVINQHQFLYSQDFSSFSISYEYGAKCDFDENGERKRGGCVGKDLLEFKMGKRLRIRKSLVVNIFIEYSDQQGVSNKVVSDSSNMRKARKVALERTVVENFLLRFISIQNDTLIDFDLDDFEAVMNESMEKSGRLNPALKDTLFNKLRKSLNYSNFSTLRQNVLIEFSVRGVDYTLSKSSTNSFWEFSKYGDTVRHKIISPAFDSYLYENMPEAFRGNNVIINYQKELLSEVLKSKFTDL